MFASQQRAEVRTQSNTIASFAVATEVIYDGYYFDDSRSCVQKYQEYQQFAYSRANLEAWRRFPILFWSMKETLLLNHAKNWGVVGGNVLQTSSNLYVTSSATFDAAEYQYQTGIDWLRVFLAVGTFSPISQIEAKPDVGLLMISALHYGKDVRSKR